MNINVDILPGKPPTNWQKIRMPLIGFLAVAGIVVYIFLQISDGRNQIKEADKKELLQVVRKVPEYQDDPNYYDHLAIDAVEVVFDEQVSGQFTLGRRSSTTTVEVDFRAYSTSVLRHMKQQAIADGREEVAEALQRHWESNGYPSDASLMNE